MNSVFDILEQITETSSRNKKKEILRQNKNNQELKKFLLYSNNPRWIYGIGAKSIKQFNATPTHKIVGVQQNRLFDLNTPNTIYELCDELRKHPYGSNNDVNMVNKFLQSLDERAYTWNKRLLLKDLKMGCSVKTINDVLDNYIPVFEVQLAFPIEHKPNRVNGEEFVIQRKYNGFRLITYHLEDGKLQFFTRNGVELFDFPTIEEAFKRVQTFPGGMVYDGELTSNSDKVNDVMSLAMEYGPKRNVCYNIWDCLTVSEFEKGKSFDNYFHRIDLARTLFKDINTSFINLVVDLYRGNDDQKIHTWYDYSQEQNWEGVMVKFNTPYVRKRTSDMLKVKGYETEDLRVISVNEGKEDSKYIGKLGSVTVDYNGNQVNVGSGFSDYQRQQFWEDPNLILDKIIEVRFFEQTNNKQNTHSLQHPRFVQLRKDKN